MLKRVRKATRMRFRWPQRISRRQVASVHTIRCGCFTCVDKQVIEALHEFRYGMNSLCRRSTNSATNSAPWRPRQPPTKRRQAEPTPTELTWV